MFCNSGNGRKVFSKNVIRFMEKLKGIGTRCSVLIKNNIFSLVILPTADKKKAWLLLLWLLAWTVGGVIIMFNYFSITQQSAKLFLIIWLCFWAYFEFKIFKVCLWKLFGKEKLWIKNGTIYYQHNVNGKGKTKEYDLNLISDLELIPLDERNFADVFAQSFWVKGGERIVFKCQDKFVKFGMQLSNEDSYRIIVELKKQLNKKPSK